MSDTRKLFDLTVDEFRQLFFPDHSAHFAAPGIPVIDTPAPVVVPGRTYKFACELVNLPEHIRRLYGTDDDIREAYIREAAENFPDAFRKRFLLKG